MMVSRKLIADVGRTSMDLVGMESVSCETYLHICD